MVEFRDYQKEDITHWVESGYRSLWAWDPGLGKTFVAGYIIKRMLSTKRSSIAAIFCPASVLSTWEHHLVDKVGIPSEMIFRAYKNKLKRNIYKGQPIILLNYEKIYNEPAKKKKKHKPAMGFSRDADGKIAINLPEAATKEAAPRGVKLPVKPDLWVLDESHFLKNPDSISYKFFKEAIDRGDKVLLLSGTPAPNRHVDCFTQVDILTPGVLGNNIHHFHNRHCLCIDKQYGLWAVKPSAVKFIEDSARKVWRFRDAKLILNLPEHTEIFEHYETTKEQREYINTLWQTGVASFFTEEGKEIKVALKNPTVIRTMCQQILTGYIDMEVTEAFTNAKVKIAREFDMEPKYKALKKTLDTLEGRKMLIWTHFIPTTAYLVKRLREDGYKVDGFSSEDKKDLEPRIQKFVKGDVQILVSHPKILGIGRNEFAEITYMHWYELTDDWGLYKQATTRIDRFGKKAPTFSYILRGSALDRKMFEALTEKKDVDTSLRTYTGEDVSSPVV